MRLFDTYWRPTRTPPPTPAGVFWLIWSLGFAMTAAWAWLGHWTYPLFSPWLLAGSFVGVEALAICLAHFRGVRGCTYSEWVWWFIPNWLVKAFWTANLIYMTAIYMHPLAAVLLAIWLFPHFAMRGRSES